MTKRDVVAKIRQTIQSELSQTMKSWDLIVQIFIVFCLIVMNFIGPHAIFSWFLIFVLYNSSYRFSPKQVESLANHADKSSFYAYMANVNPLILSIFILGWSQSLTLLIPALSSTSEKAPSHWTINSGPMKLLFKLFLGPPLALVA